MPLKYTQIESSVDFSSPSAGNKLSPKNVAALVTSCIFFQVAVISV